MTHDVPQAVRRILSDHEAKVFFSCEHASQTFPDGWALPEGDRWLKDTHWAYDLGAAELTEELAARFQAEAILSGFSRLLVDPNRPVDSDTLFRGEAEGRAIGLNQDLQEEDIDRRMKGLYHAYHDAFGGAVAQSEASVIFSVHSFTPVYEGERRPMEVGVLFDEEEALAEGVARALHEGGFKVAMNEPYSGKAGLIYAVQQHAHASGRHAIEVELRQDLAVQPEARARVVEALYRHREIFDLPRRPPSV